MIIHQLPMKVKIASMELRATVEEMARTVMFLASDDATAFHGSLVDVTSGILD